MLPPCTCSGGFDYISYQKGGSVLRMVRAYLKRGAITLLTNATTPSVQPLPLPLRRLLAPQPQGQQQGQQKQQQPRQQQRPSNSGESVALSPPIADPFLLGLSAYLTAFQYSNGNYSVMWDHLAAAAGEPLLGAQMRTWTLRGGYPVVSARVEGGKLLVEQVS